MKKLLALAAVGIAATGLTGCLNEGTNREELTDFFALMGSTELVENSTLDISMMGMINMTVATDSNKIQADIMMSDPTTSEVLEETYFQEYKDSKYYAYNKLEDVWYVQEIDATDALDVTEFTDAFKEFSELDVELFDYVNNQWVVEEEEDGTTYTTTITFNADGSVKMAVSIEGMGEYMSLAVSNVGTTVVTLPANATPALLA
ncbi:MAG: hypothetical protein R3Y60_02325 [bacterium]